MSFAEEIKHRHVMRAQLMNDVESPAILTLDKDSQVFMIPIIVHMASMMGLLTVPFSPTPPPVLPHYP